MKLIISFIALSILSIGIILYKGNTQACVACDGMSYNPLFNTCCYAGPPDTPSGGGAPCCPASSGSRECNGDYVHPFPNMCAF